MSVRRGGLSPWRAEAICALSAENRPCVHTVSADPPISVRSGVRRGVRGALAQALLLLVGESHTVGGFGRIEKGVAIAHDGLGWELL